MVQTEVTRMTTKQADKLIAGKTWISLTDTYGDTGEMVVTSRDRRTIEYVDRAGDCGKIERSSVASFRPV